MSNRFVLSIETFDVRRESSKREEMTTKRRSTSFDDETRASSTRE